MKSQRINVGAALLALLVAPSLGGAQTLDRSKIPALGPPPKVSLPPIVTRQLPNGLRLMIVEQHELPLADFVLVVGSGGTMDPATRGGLANLTAAMLTEGTTTRNSLQIADQIAYLGVGLSAGSNWDASTISLHTPTSQLDSALALFSDVVLHPAFTVCKLPPLLPRPRSAGRLHTEGERWDYSTTRMDPFLGTSRKAD